MTNQWLPGDAGRRVEGDPETFRTAAGADGGRVRYRTPTSDGLLGAVVLDGTDGPVGIEIVATGPVDAPGPIATDLLAMIDSIARTGATP